MSAEKECQPCEHYQRPEWEADFESRHQCLAPFEGIGQRTVTCLGTVRFCANCHSDHHSGGYQTCAGIRTCIRNHPACIAVIAARESK